MRKPEGTTENGTPYLRGAAAGFRGGAAAGADRFGILSQHDLLRQRMALIYTALLLLAAFGGQMRIT